MRRAAIFTVLCAAGALSVAQTTHYLDCSVSVSGDSLRPDSAWNSIEQANAVILQPGDRLLLRRGSACDGELAPQGSGTPASPILLGTYGAGSLPVIHGGSHPAGLALFNQQYWEIEDLEIVGGSPYGIHISGNLPELTHFRLRNLVVHDVPGIPVTKESGLIVIAPEPKAPTHLNDIVVDGVTVYNTSQWSGIIISGAVFNDQEHAYGEHVEVRNSVIHDVAGDGVLLASLKHAVLERNVAWNTGMQETESIGTPNALWQWMCVDCRVAWNEGFFSDSPGVDGGVYDIDFGDIENVVEHNFAHDSQGYCVSVFGAEGHGGDSINSIVRHNTCLHNARSPRLARRQGAVYVNTWKGGRLNGVRIEDNTILWTPPLDAPAIHIDADFFGDMPNRVAGNTIFLEAGTAMLAPPQVQISGNRVIDSASLSTKDFCTGWSVLQPVVATAASTLGWRLVALLSPSDAGNIARGLSVTLASLAYQFRDRDLHTVLWLRDAPTREAIDKTRIAWHLRPSLEVAASRLSSDTTDGPALVLLTPAGDVAAQWSAPVDPAVVWLAVAARLGTPVGMQSMPFCPSR